MLFWEEPVVCAFVRAAALARVEIDHVHDVSVSTKHECIHLIYSCRWFFLHLFIAAQARTMGQAEELYFAMVDVGYTARRCKIPGPLSQTMIDTARDWLETWREDERTLISFASMLLSDPSGVLTPQCLCAVRGQLPEPFVDACWRLLRLLEYLRIDPDAGILGGSDG